MDLATARFRDADRLDPAPLAELARLRRLLDRHRRLPPPFGGAMIPGSFNRIAARALVDVSKDVKMPFTFAF